jgi:hypothetical protein
MCCRTFLGRDPDDMFAYTTGRKLSVRDRRLGLLFLVSQLAIAGYVVVYSIILKQGYMRTGSIQGVVRLQLKRPDTAFQWANGDAPYCKGGTANGTTDYAFPALGSYRYIGDPSRSVTSIQGTCEYADARFAVPNAGETNAIFLPTRTTLIHEVATPANSCTTLQNSFCAWNTVNSSLTYLADAEMFTLLIDHSFSSDVGVVKSSLEMAGELLSPSGLPVDACASYDVPRFRNAGVSCPSYIQVGKRDSGSNDIVSIRTLLNAAGVETLDEVSGVTPSLATQTKRYGGIVMLIAILYSNHYLPGNDIPFGTKSLDPTVVHYGYRVSIIPEQEYKAERVFTSNNEVCESNIAHAVPWST